MLYPTLSSWWSKKGFFQILPANQPTMLGSDPEVAAHRTFCKKHWLNTSQSLESSEQHQLCVEVLWAAKWGNKRSARFAQSLHAQGCTSISPETTETAMGLRALPGSHRSPINPWWLGCGAACPCCPSMSQPKGKRGSIQSYHCHKLLSRHSINCISRTLQI